MTTLYRRTQWIPVTIFAVLATLPGCAEEAGSPTPSGQVVLAPTQEVAEQMKDLVKAALPDQTAILDIVGVQTDIPMTVNADGSVSATVTNLPPGTQTFRITYRSGNLVVAQANGTANVVANTTAPVALTSLDTTCPSCDNDQDGASNLLEIRSGTNPLNPSDAPVVATQVSSGAQHSCALITGGNVRCWGDNQYKQLGNSTGVDSNVPVAVGLSLARSVAAGGLFTCAIVQFLRAGIIVDGVRCLGDNGGGLGDGTTTDSAVGVAVANVDGPVSLVAGSFHACALLANPGSIRCWGDNTYGQLGDGTTVRTIGGKTPPSVQGITNATAIAAGENHTCARLADGTVRCWGRNTFGQLGNGVTSGELPNATPVTVQLISDATTVFAGRDHTCVILSDSAVRCWGQNTNGQLADNTSSNIRSLRVFSGFTSVADMLLGTDFTCARQTNSTVRCAGANGSGQLGNNSPNPSTSSVEVANLNTAASLGSVGGGRLHACALLNNGGVRCWGDNQNGQLGNGTTGGISRVPVQVVGFP